MDQELTTHEKTDFDPEAFLDTYYSTFNPNGNHELDYFYKFVLDSLHQVFREGTIKGDSLLDIGTGPMCYNVYNPSKWFKEIVLSDVSEDNLAVLNEWKKGKIKHGKAVFDYMMGLESDQCDWISCNIKLAEKVSAIVKSDLHNTNPLSGSGLENRTYDAISLPLSQNSASTTVEQYEQSVRNYSKLLNPGGHLIVIDVLHEDHYVVGKHSFKVLNATKEMTEGIYENNGYQVLEWRGYDGAQPINEQPFVMVARKT